VFFSFSSSNIFSVLIAFKVSERFSNDFSRQTLHELLLERNTFFPLKKKDIQFRCNILLDMDEGTELKLYKKFWNWREEKLLEIRKLVHSWQAFATLQIINMDCGKDLASAIYIYIYNLKNCHSHSSHMEILP